MKPKNIQNYLCVPESLTPQELEASELFWEIDFDELKFVYKVKDINQRFFSISSNIHTLIISKITFSCDLPGFKCVNCGAHKSIRLRSDFLLQTRQIGFTCLKCLTDQELEIIEKFSSLVEKYTSKLFDGVFDYESLSYFEKVFLFLLVLDFHREDGYPLLCDINEINITGSQNIDREYINNLASKGALLCIENIDTEILKLKQDFRAIRDKRFKYHEENKSIEGRPNYQCNEMDEFASGIYLRFIGFNDSMELQSALFTDILDRHLTKSDFEDFRYIVENARASLLYKIVEVYSQEFNFKTANSGKLESSIKYLLNTYSLPVISNYLHQRAKDVSSNLNVQPVPGYIQNKLYAKAIDDHLTKVKMYNWEITFRKYLPFELDTPLLESFLCQHFFKSELNWFELNVSEILEKWAEGMNLDDS